MMWATQLLSLPLSHREFSSYIAPPTFSDFGKKNLEPQSLVLQKQEKKEQVQSTDL